MAINAGKSLGLAIVIGMSLSACGDKSEGDILVPTTRSDTGRVEDQFGEDFAKAHRADPNAEPANVSEMKLPPVSYTAEPVPID